MVAGKPAAFLGNNMAKYLRKKSDGYIYHFNQKLSERPDMESFDFDGVAPERIPNLSEFLKPSEEAPKRRAAKNGVRHDTATVVP